MERNALHPALFVFFAMAYLSFIGRSHAVEETTQIFAKVFEHQLGKHLRDENVCLSMSAPGIFLREDASKGAPSDLIVLGDGRDPLSVPVPSELINLLRAKGYNVFPSDECVYRTGDELFPRSSSERAVLVAIEPPRYEGDTIFVSYHHWGGFSVCSGEVLTLRRQNGNFKVLESKLEYIC